MHCRKAVLIREKEEKGTQKKRGENSLTSNEANARVFIRSRDKLFYCRTIERNHEGDEGGQSVARTKLLQNGSMKEDQE